MSSEDIVITANSVYSEEQCLDFNEGVCVHWITYYPEQTINHYKVATTESYSNVVVLAVILLLWLWFVKGIFRLILPWRWK